MTYSGPRSRLYLILLLWIVLVISALIHIVSWVAEDRPLPNVPRRTRAPEPEA